MIRKVVGVLVLGAGIGVTLVACSASGDSDAYPSAESFCSAKAEEECKAGADRCAVSQDKCKSARVSACQAIVGSTAGQGRTYQPANAQGCIDKTKELYTAATLTPDKEREVADACDRVFTGKRKAGENCTLAAPDPNRTQAGDCEGDLICDRTFCAEKREVAIDKPCGNPGEVCAKDAYCQARGGSSFCTAKNAVDQTCSAEAPCIDTLRCVNRCTSKNEAGGVCDTNGECATGFCDLAQTPRRCSAKQLASGNALCKEFGGS